jgi:hypothetical protein
MGRAGRGRITPPRSPFAGGTVTIRLDVSESDAKPSEVACSRRYDDRRGAVEVLRSARHPDAEELPYGYLYDGHPLIESWPTDATPTPYNNRIIEMRSTTYALAEMGIANVSMTPRDPPDPDMYFESPETGLVGAEVTMNMAHDESEFQDQMRQFIDYLNSFVEAPGFEFPFAVNLGFVKVPKVSAHEPIARDIIAQVRANASQKGRHEFAGDLGELFLQYLVADREEQPPFSGGAVANERGVPDYYETALRRIAEKRDMSDYSVRGRKNWLILSATADPLFSPDRFERLFETNVELGQFDCIVAVRPSSFVRFQRVASQAV